MNNSMGMLNRPIDDPLAARSRKRVTVAPPAPPPPPPPPPNRMRPTQPQTAAVPPMYLPPTQAPPKPLVDAGAKLEMWRKRREERQRTQQQPVPVLAGPSGNAATAAIPSTELRASQPATPLNDSPVVILQQRLQEYGLTLNNIQNQLDNIKTSFKAMQGQSTEDRKMLLQQVTVQDFKDLHNDLNDAVTCWCEETEKKLTEALQEINDRSFQMNAEVLISCPVLAEPQMSAVATPAPLEPGTRIRVSYPQTKTEEGVFMRYLHVNDVAEISYLWVPIVGGDTTRYVGKFSV